MNNDIHTCDRYRPSACAALALLAAGRFIAGPPTAAAGRFLDDASSSEASAALNHDETALNVATCLALAGTTADFITCSADVGDIAATDTDTNDAMSLRNTLKARVQSRLCMYAM